MTRPGEKKVLVVGATGQVGSTVVKKLAERGVAVRALARPLSERAHLELPGVEVTQGDLIEPSSLEAACADVHTVISTATAHIPRFPKDDFRLIDDIGYSNLIDACKQQGVSRLVFCSSIQTPHDDWVPLMKFKRRVESRIMSSGLDYTIVRGAAFMDVAFVLVGSSIPIAGADAPTVKRPYPFALRHVESVRHSIEEHGIAHLPGDGTARHSFICGRDVADFLINAGLSSEGRNIVINVGGPQALSWLDMVRMYEALLGTRLRAKKTPALVFRALSILFSVFSTPASNLMALNYLFAATDAVVEDAEAVAARFDVRLTSAWEFLREKYQQYVR